MTDQQSRSWQEQSSTLGRVAYQSGFVFALLAMVSGVAGILGVFPDLRVLAEPLADWPPVPLLAAIGLAAAGLALWQFLQLRYRSALAAGAVSAAAAVVSLVARLTTLPVEFYSMSLSSALLIISGVVPIMIISARRRLLPDEASLGIAGFVLLSLAATLLIARATGFTDTTLDFLGGGPSLQVLIASFLFGVCYVALVWSRGLLSGDTARWLPLALGVAGVVTVTVLWRALAAREDDQVVALTRQAGDERRRVLRREVDGAARSLHRAAEWRDAGVPAAQQRRDMHALQRDIPGLQGAGWISALGVIDTATAASLSGIGADSATLVYVNRNGRLPDSIAFVPLDGAERNFAIIAPVCDFRLCRGAMVAILNTSALFQDVVPDTARGFRYAIIGPAGRLGGVATWQDGTARWTQWEPLRLGDVRLTLAATPTLSTLGRVRSELPMLVLLMGLVVSALVPLSVLLAQRALRSARDVERSRISSALERTTDGIWEWDLTTGSSVHSPGIWRYLGYDPESVPPIRDAWLALVHPDDQPRLAREIEDHLNGVRPSFDAEYRVLARDGTWHAIVDRGRVVDRTSGGHPARMVGIKADVTVARSAQQARESAEQRFREIFDSGFQYQLLLDRASAVVEINAHALDETHVNAEDVRGRLVWNTFWWARNPAAQDRLRAATSAALRGLTRRYEEEFPAEDGVRVWLEIAVKPLTGDASTPTQILLEARDITARRRVDSTLREVEALTTMGRVAAHVAHEINNPLAGIQNSFLLIKGAIPASHPHFSYVGAIEREIARIAAVTRQLYETYRPEQEGGEGAAVATVIGDATAFLEQVNRAAGVRIRTELNGGPGVIPYPSALLRQIAYNLVQNAIEASPEGGEVVVRTRAEDGFFEVRVSDSGGGVPPESRERIFEPFYSTKSGRLRTGGMGLGLALVRRTVIASGGMIRVGDAEGGGAEFVVTLPLDPKHEEN
jgi:PAS domain S-box-containing protein